MTPGTRKISLYFLMACAVVLSIVSVETVSSRLGHAIVPVQLEAVNRTAKGNRLPSQPTIHERTRWAQGGRHELVLYMSQAE